MSSEVLAQQPVPCVSVEPQGRAKRARLVEATTARVGAGAEPAQLPQQAELQLAQTPNPMTLFAQAAEANNSTILCEL